MLNHTERVVADSWLYSVGTLECRPEPRHYYDDITRFPAFVRRLTAMTLAPGQHNAALDRALTPAKTLARLVLAQFAPVVKCPKEASCLETEAECRVNPLQARALVSPTFDNVSRALEAALDQRVALDRYIHSLASTLGQMDAVKDNLWSGRAA